VAELTREAIEAANERGRVIHETQPHVILTGLIDSIHYAKYAAESSSKSLEFNAVLSASILSIR
jgi:hypothetical protein